MKKILLLITILLLTSCSKYNNEFNVQSTLCGVIINNSNKSIINRLMQEKYFICDNLNSYLNYYLLGNNNTSNVVSEVNAGSVKEYYSNTNKSDLSKDILILINKYNYLDKKYVPSDLEEISLNYNIGYNNKLRKEARINFEDMCLNAKKEGILLYSISAYRSFYNQEIIYNNYLKIDANNTDSYSARAGYSEHQSGLAVDINMASSIFSYTIEYYWLKNNAYKYGFIERYPKNKEKITGYKYEPWHFRYVGKEVAKRIAEENITFDEYYAYYLS